MEHRWPHLPPPASDDPVCAVCGKTIPPGTGRYRYGTDSVHAECDKLEASRSPALARTRAAAHQLAARLRLRVPTRLKEGVLFPVGDVVGAGHGSGEACTVCDQPIGSGDVEYRVGLARAHRSCFNLWYEMSVAHRQAASNS
jgi:hypothetical protein